MGEPLSRGPVQKPAPVDAPGGADEVTGIHLREARRGGARPRTHAGARPDPGVTLLVLRPDGTGQRAYRLGERPGRRLLWGGLTWLLALALAGAALRLSVGPLQAPLRLGWAKVRAGASFALPLTGWTRLPDARREPARPGDAEARARELQLGSRPVASQLLRGEVDPRWSRAAARLGITPTRFLWPVARGWFVRGYGSGTGGYHLAVDVAAEEGSTVRAAADGLVAYAGDEVRGFGNLLMLVHGGGFVTMYAHNQTHAVEAGEFVRAGAPIATLGNTGISRGPHVHFELMHGGRNCDPVPLFEPGVRHRESGFDTSRTTEWLGARPRGVRCERRKRHPHSRWGADGPVADALEEAAATDDPASAAAAPAVATPAAPPALRTHRAPGDPPARRADAPRAAEAAPASPSETAPMRPAADDGIASAHEPTATPDVEPAAAVAAPAPAPEADVTEKADVAPTPAARIPTAAPAAPSEPPGESAPEVE